MDFSKIKMVVSDMDGTLLNSNGEVSPTFFQLFKRLKENKIHFVAASGRQFYSIIEKLDAIKNEIIIIAENGGITKKGQEELHTFTLPKNSIKELIEIVRKIKGAEIILCGKKQAYVESENEAFLNYFQQYYIRYKKLEDLTTLPEDEFFKIAIYHKDNSEKHIYPHLKHLTEGLQIKISGKNWVDISDKQTHKGNALEKLQASLNIKKSETMVFGDYNNDLEMLSLGDFSYAMENAHPNVKKTALYATKSNDEAGVEYILEKVLTRR